MRAGEFAEQGPRPLKRALAAALVLVACARGEPARPTPDAGAPSPAPLRDFASGTRLHVVRWVFDDVEMVRELHDVALDVACDFDLPGATRRCLPSARAVHREGAGPYADAACAEPWAASEAQAPFAVVTPRDACAGAPVVHRTGPIEERTAFFRDGDACVRAAFTVTMQPLREVIPADSFVAAHEQNERRDGRIDARVLVADDGARVTIGGFDRVRGEVVAPDDAADGLLRWLPARVAFRNAGADPPAHCAAAATKIASSASCALSAALVLEGICGRGRFHALGAPIADCIAGSLAFALGDAIPADTFVRATYTDRGWGDVRRRSFDDVMLGGLVDAASGEPCRVVLASDGVPRCLPDEVAFVAYFADPACETPAFARPITGCEIGAPRTLVRDGARAYEVVGTAASLYESRGGACAPFEPTVASELLSVRELAASRFAAARELRD